MKKVPKDNRDPVIRDLKNEQKPVLPKITLPPAPQINVRAAEVFLQSSGDEHVTSDIIRPHRRIPAPVFFAGIFFAMIVSVFLIYRVSVHYTNLALINATRIREASDDLKSLKPQEAQEKMLAARDALNDPFAIFATKVLPLFMGSAGALQNIQGLMDEGLSISNEVLFLKQHAVDLVVHKKGDELLSSLKKIHTAMADMNAKTKELSAAASNVARITASNQQLFSVMPDMARYEKFMGSLVDFLGTPSSRHVLVLLQNPSEMRPGGGFLGSYADLTIKQGGFENIAMHDINDIDRTFDQKIIPPKPLQISLTSWKTADANWFFDFPTSAQKVIEFAEASHLYKDTNTTFDAAIAISPKVITDILAVTGPIFLNESNVTIDEKNFLTEVQKQVQLGQAAKKEKPKSILEEAAPLLADRLSKLSEDDQAKLFERMKTWGTNRDAMAYFKDSNLMGFFDELSVTGKIYPLTQNFYGDYLALVDANVGGGKADIFIAQKVTLQSQLADDGTVSNHLVISRTHNGDKGKYWWYKVLNQDYLQVLTPEGSNLVGLTGIDRKTIYPKVNYAKSGYAVDAAVAAIEASTTVSSDYPLATIAHEFGKTVFGTWSILNVGESEKMTLDYTRRLPLTPAEGQVYQFVFEKQAGTVRSYHFEISAPVGFRWKEAKLPVYEYTSDDPPGRMIVNLTLEKLL